MKLEVVVFCFEKTELQSLWADVHVLNIASYKTLEKAGFKREGHIRDGKMVNTYCDYYLYGVTKTNYYETGGFCYSPPLPTLMFDKEAQRKPRKSQTAYPVLLYLFLTF